MCKYDLSSHPRASSDILLAKKSSFLCAIYIHSKTIENYSSQYYYRYYFVLVFNSNSNLLLVLFMHIPTRSASLLQSYILSLLFIFQYKYCNPSLFYLFIKICNVLNENGKQYFKLKVYIILELAFAYGYRIKLIFIFFQN